MGIYGQDWASYQPAAPDTAGLGFVFIKVTEGLGYTNPLWQAQRDHARAAGLVVGYYHYPHMNNSPQTEADHFLSIAQPAAGELLVLDWEGYDSANSGVPRSAQLAYKEAFLRHLKAAAPHQPVGMYCNTDYWNNVDTTGYVQDFLWIATAGRAAGDPGIRANWLFHQYTDQPVDSDFCPLASTDALRQWALAFQPPPASTPAPQPTPVPAPTLQGEDMAVLPIPFGFAFDAASKLTNKKNMLVTPVPELGGTRIGYRMVDLTLGCDMGDVRVRIAVYNETAKQWPRVWEADIKAGDTRYPIWLQPGDTKVSIGRMPASATDTDGANVPCSLLIEPVLA